MCNATKSPSAIQRTNSIDFSEYSEFALEAASNLARKYDSELIVLHMLELSNGNWAILSDNGATFSVAGLNILDSNWNIIYSGYQYI